MLTHFLTAYFTRELAKLHYPDMEVGWNLNHCQGDGMCFWGGVYGVDLDHLAARLLAGDTLMMYQALAAKDCRPSITIKHTGRDYHSHSMTVEWEWEQWSGPDLHEVQEAVLERWQTQVEQELYAAVEEEIEDIAKRLEREGYKLYEASSPGWFTHNPAEFVGDRYRVVHRAYQRTGFRVEARLWDAAEYNPYEGDEEEYAAEVVAKLLNGTYVAYEVEVVVLDDDDTELASLYSGDVIDDAALTCLRGIVLDLFHDIEDEAREAINQLDVAA